MWKQFLSALVEKICLWLVVCWGLQVNCINEHHNDVKNIHTILLAVLKMSMITQTYSLSIFLN